MSIDQYGSKWVEGMSRLIFATWPKAGVPGWLPGGGVERLDWLESAAGYLARNHFGVCCFLGPFKLEIESAQRTLGIEDLDIWRVR